MNAQISSRPAHAELPPLMDLAARDGETLYFRQYSDGQDIDLILLPDLGCNSASVASLAKTLLPFANVFTPELRGHQGKWGDLDYPRQLEDDLADLCLELRRHDPIKRPIVLVGVGTGGALALRFASGPNQQAIQGATLLNPRFINLPLARYLPGLKVRRWLTAPLWLLGPLGLPLQRGLWAATTENGFRCSYAMLAAFGLPRFLDTDLPVFSVGQAEGRAPLSLPMERPNLKPDQLLQSTGLQKRLQDWLKTLSQQPEAL
ncbi:alpha/beta hydrolase [Pokkaliibacter sp. CJK22405]|uniref:alpha/beta hydrolase n=1 Tax=Pokkaliibacter sp. CJK22405 TaxID=3384615 RepID=UPI00398468E5